MYQLFSISEGISSRGGLSSCLKKLKIPFKGRKHNALDDAYNTAVLLDRIIRNKEVTYDKILSMSKGVITTSEGLIEVIKKDDILNLGNRNDKETA
jgi:inhibitor of KinA sporulation pathway (predicted exonuclease)